jgi:hypothetical protein
VYLKTGLIRGMASLEGDNLVVFYYHSVSENWPDKRYGLSGDGQSSGILLSQCKIPLDCLPPERPSLLSGQFSDTLRK